jgi:hypothetical protein
LVGTQGTTGVTGTPGSGTLGHEAFLETGAGASISARSVVLVLGPAGVIYADGLGVRLTPGGPAIAVDSEVGGSANDLIIDYGASSANGMVLLDFGLSQVDNSVPSPASGIIPLSVATKTNLARNQARITGYQTAVGATVGAVLYLKFIG